MYTTTFLIAYLAVLNLLTWLTFAFDKSQSLGGRRRISEKTLLLLTLVGGTIGALVGMNMFRHKTKKISFQLPFFVIILLQVLLIVWVVYHYATATNTLFR